ncbi:MAG UNVERIFIED_CONTAM: hypothetical protein LVR18_26690 [Planctomycetaceae bacterium]
MGLEEIHPYLLEKIPVENFGDEQRLALSERIRNGELYAFVEIPAEVLQPRPLTPDNITNPSVELMQLAGMALGSSGRRSLRCSSLGRRSAQSDYPSSSPGSQRQSSGTAYCHA